MPNNSNVDITVKDFIDLYRDIIGSDDQCAIDLINRARIKAWSLADGVGVSGFAAIPISNGCIVLPSSIQSIRGPRFSRNEYDCCFNGYFEVSESVYCGCVGSSVASKDGEKQALPFLLSVPEKVQFRAVNKSDAGKTIVIRYYDSSDTIRTEQLVLDHIDPVTTGYKVKKAEYVEKPVTNGKIQVSTASGSKGIFMPIDTLPMHSVYNFSIGGAPCGDYCVVCVIKKRYFKFTVDSLDELLDINPESLIKFIRASQLEVGSTGAEYNLSAALTSAGAAHMNLEKTDDEKTTIPARGVDGGFSITDELANL